MPDAICVRERLLALELKTDTGRLRPEQAVWLDRLIWAGVECYVARPRDSAALEAALRLRWEEETTAATNLVLNFETATREEVSRALAKQGVQSVSSDGRLSSSG
jgi:hypothetical protein